MVEDTVELMSIADQLGSEIVGHHQDVGHPPEEMAQIVVIEGHHQEADLALVEGQILTHTFLAMVETKMCDEEMTAHPGMMTDGEIEIPGPAEAAPRLRTIDSVRESATYTEDERFSRSTPTLWRVGLKQQVVPPVYEANGDWGCRQIMPYLILTL